MKELYRWKNSRQEEILVNDNLIVQDQEQLQQNQFQEEVGLLDYQNVKR